MPGPETLKAEIAKLEQQRAKLLASLQQTEGALGFARYLLAQPAAPETPPARDDAETTPTP